MKMAIQHQGYYENGNYYLDDVSDIPDERVRVTVIFHDVEDKRQQKVAAIKNILADALKAENDLTDEDWNQMANLRPQTNIGLARTVKI
jgi:hypothetical protein